MFIQKILNSNTLLKYLTRVLLSLTKKLVIVYFDKYTENVDKQST